MSRTFKSVALIVVLMIPFSLIIPYLALYIYRYITPGDSTVKSSIVQEQYSNAFNSTCAIHVRGGSATGILLNTGYILTARHVIDADDNNVISNEERSVRVSFIADASRVHTGTVIYASAGESDFAIVATATKPNRAGVKLISNLDYEKVLAGAKLFAIGRSMGQDPPHLTSGIRSTDNHKLRDRAALSIFFGNSGGGVFEEEGGMLIGLANHIHIYRGIMVPSWAEYIPAPVIRNELRIVGLSGTVDQWEYNSNGDLLYIVIILLGGAICVFAIFQQLYLCQELRRMRRNNA